MSKTFKEFVNEMQEIKFKNEVLSWNPNKTELDWKKRIKDRTKMSELDFCKTIQKGIDKTPIPVDEAICLYFFRSEFVLILNTKNKIITTIRDAKWDKPGNNCKQVIIANETVKTEEFFEEFLKPINNNLTGNNGWDGVINEKFEIVINHNCNYCFKVDL